MSTIQTVTLAAIAGFTIYLGLLLGRVRFKRPATRIFLSGLSAGVLLFLFMETLHASTELVEEAFEEHNWTEAAGFSLVYLVSFGVGLLSLLYMSRRAQRQPLSQGPGAMAATEVPATATPAEIARKQALELGLSIAIGIGLHNFSEGLAIGAAAAAEQISLAVLLVIGFALHNATEGFGIVGPLAGADVRPTWGWLGLMGLIGGGPTFLGALIGGSFTSEWVTLSFFALAAGAILYVIGELFEVGKRANWGVTVWGVFAGIVLGVGTEMIIKAAGG
jgi:ZIP family zinc transporter